MARQAEDAATKGPSRPGGALVVVTCSTGLVVGFADALLALAADPSGFPSLPSILPSMALLAAPAALGAGVLVLLLSVLSRGMAGGRFLSWAVAVEGFCAAAFTLLWIGGLNRVGAFTGAPRNALVQAGVVAAIALAVGLALFLLIERRVRDQRAECMVLFGLSAGTVALGELLLALAWLSVGAQAASTVHHAAAAVAFLAAAAVSALILLLGRTTRLPECVMAGLLAAVLVGGVWTFPRERPRNAPPQETPGARPIRQVILVTVDTLRRDAVTCYDPEGVGTPGMDALAADSLLFTNALTASPWTIPSFVSLMTAVAADVHGVGHDFAAIPGRYRTLAEYLSEAGYLTAAVGDHPQLLRMNRGFHEFDFTPTRLPVNSRTTGGKVLWRLLRREYATSDITDRACQWLEQHRDDDFFLWVHYLDPHTPYTPPPRYIPDDPLVARYGARFEGKVSDVRSGRMGRTPEERQWIRLLYESEVRYVDDNIGRLTASAKTLGLYKDALVVLTNDHGEEFWDHGNFEHGHTLYNELVSAVLMVKLPGNAPAQPIGRTVSHSAVLPTVLDLCGVPFDRASMTAQPLTPLWSGPATAETEPVFISGVEYYAPREAVVLDGHKYIRLLDGGVTEAYDLADDPGEQRNIAAEQQHQAARAVQLLGGRQELRQRLGPGDVEDGGPLDADIVDALDSLGYIQ